MSGRLPARAWGWLRNAWDRATVYLPVVLMGLIALGTYLLARNTPVFGPGPGQEAPRHEPDYFLRRFTVKSFDASGRLTSELTGAEGRHYPDTDTLEIDEPRIRAINARGELTVATARRALANGDASEVQLFGDAVVSRVPGADAAGRDKPGLQVRSEFLHFFVNTEKMRTHKPVEVVRGGDRFTADSLAVDNLDQQVQMEGRVRGLIAPSRPK